MQQPPLVDLNDGELQDAVTDLEKLLLAASTDFTRDNLQSERDRLKAEQSRRAKLKTADASSRGTRWVFHNFENALVPYQISAHGGVSKLHAACRDLQDLDLLSESDAKRLQAGARLHRQGACMVRKVTQAARTTLARLERSAKASSGGGSKRRQETGGGGTPHKRQCTADEQSRSVEAERSAVLTEKVEAIAARWAETREMEDLPAVEAVLSDAAKLQISGTSALRELVAEERRRRYAVVLQALGRRRQGALRARRLRVEKDLKAEVRAT